MKKVVTYFTMVAMLVCCMLTFPVAAQAATITSKSLIGTWKSSDGDYTIGLFDKGVLKIKAAKGDKWVAGTWKLDSSKKTVAIKEEKYLKDSTSFKYTEKKLTSSSNSKFYLKKTSSKTPSTSTLKKSAVTGTWISQDKETSMVLTSDGNVYKKLKGDAEYEKVNEIGTWSLNASKKTVSTPDYVYALGELKYSYTKDKLTLSINNEFYFTKVSSNTNLK